MKPIVQIAYNAVVAKVYGGDTEARDLIAQLTTFEVEGAEFSDAFKLNKWDGKSSLYKYSNDTFPAGFVEIAIEELQTKGYQVQRIARPLPAPLGPERPKIDDLGYSEKYDYQPATVDRLIESGRMIARVATGGGKSRIARIAHARIGRRTLFVTTRKDLMYQMKKGFEASGYEVGVIGDNTWEPITNGENRVNVAMVQTLASRLEKPNEYDRTPAAQRQRMVRKNTLDLLAEVDFLIAEEAHESGGTSYYTVCNSCKSAYYRLALTATPFMRDGAESNMRLMASFGRIGIDITEKMLIDRGVLATPVFKFYPQPEKPKKLFRTTAWARAYELGIVEAAGRNAQILEFVKRCREYGLTVLILVQRRAHGTLLRDLLTKAGLRTEFVFGQSDTKTRNLYLKKLGNGSIDALIGSTIFDVGVDVPSVGGLALAGGGKAEVALRQRIGRVLRSKKHGPNVCFIADFQDEHNKTLRSHAFSREAIIKRTPGFAERLLKANDDFDFEAWGFKKRNAG